MVSISSFFTLNFVHVLVTLEYLNSFYGVIMLTSPVHHIFILMLACCKISFFKLKAISPALVSINYFFKLKAIQSLVTVCASLLI
jgi:hypothetical protein